MVINGEPYVWIYYKAVLEAIPIINIKKQALTDRFKKYVNCNLMKFRLVQNKQGSFSYYRINPDILYKLLSKPDDYWITGAGGM